MGTSKSYISKSTQNNKNVKIALRSYLDGNNTDIKKVADRIGSVLADPKSSPVKNEVGKSIGGILSFFDSVKSNGLSKVVNENVFKRLQSLKGPELINELLNNFLSDNITPEDAIIRNSLYDMLEFLKIESITDIENIDTKKCIVIFIIKYIQNTFLLQYGEYIAKKWGNVKKNSVVKEINECIHDMTYHELIKGNIDNIDWNGETGKIYIEKKCQEANRLLQIYGGE